VLWASFGFCLTRDLRQGGVFAGAGGGHTEQQGPFSQNSTPLPGSSPAAHFLVYLCAKPTLPSARYDSRTRFFYSGLRWHPLSASGNRSTYSHDFFVDTPHSRRYLAHLRHATIFVSCIGGCISAASTWRPSEGDRCSSRWYELLVNNRRWELVLNHCRAMLLAPWPPLAPRLASELQRCNPRAFLARLVVPFSSSELDLRAAAHIQRSGRSPRKYGV
jgi:hypothetical protein